MRALRPIDNFAVVAASVILLAGCTGSAPRGEEEASPATGTLTGLVTLAGGPLTLQGEPALDHDPARDWSVILRSDAKVVTTTTTDGTGRFTVELAPGTYQLDCLGGRTFEVRAEETTKAGVMSPCLSYLLTSIKAEGGTATEWSEARRGTGYPRAGVAVVKVACT